MYYFFVNPAASSGKCLSIWKRLEQILIEKSISYQVYLLTDPVETGLIASRLSRHASPCTFVILGGDGTINSVINGISDPSGITLACIPAGSGNDFCRGLSITGTPEEVLARILHPSKIIPVNLALASCSEKKHRFIVSSGIGFDAQVCHGTSTSVSKSFLNRLHLGEMVYTWIALKQLFTMKRQDMRIILDDTQLITCKGGYFAAAMNLPYEGGGYRFAPNAKPGDGYLDLIIADRIPRVLIIFCLPLAKLGLHTKIKGIRILTCKKAVIKNQTPLWIHTDGEDLGMYDKVTYSILPERIRVIIR